jgi:hypothetical protein
MEKLLYFVDAALRYVALLEAGQNISLDGFVAQEPVETRAELRDFLEFNLTADKSVESAVLTPGDDEIVDYVVVLVRGTWERDLNR